MKILCISDTHGKHELFSQSDFKGVDMIIHAGDFSNHKNPGINANEAIDFLRWYDDLEVECHKILVCGNHETSVEAKMINPNEYENIIYLEHEGVDVEGISIFGSPYTPAFNQWAFNVKATKINEYWEQVPKKIDILITHGPPKGILDLCYDSKGRLKYSGDKALFNHVERVEPAYHIFGHLHPNKDNYNAGKRTHGKTTFVNASCVTDGKFDLGLTSKGIIIEI